MMRIIVASPPKTGNVWVKHLLSKIYGLEILTPEPSDTETLKAFVEKGLFKEGTIFHQHFWPARDLFEAVAAVSCHFITMIRNPYDTFVSYYYFANNFPEILTVGDPGGVLIGRPLDDPEVLDFLARLYGELHLKLGYAWVNSGKSLVRYEDLYEKPLETLKSLTDRLRPVDDDLIRYAIETCAADKMKAQDGTLARHIRQAKVGDWRNHLSWKHLEIFRDHHADLIRALGYEVVEPSGGERSCRAFGPTSTWKRSRSCGA